MDAYKDLDRTLALLRESSVLSALAYSAIHGEKSDDVSQNEAYKQYGKAWIKDRSNRGYLHSIRVGKGATATILFSRFEIESLKRAEKYVQDVYDKIATEIQDDRA
jgi:hypothetical protein